MNEPNLPLRRRPGRPKRAETAELSEAIYATRARIFKARPPGDHEVTQAEVDEAALALVKANAHPHPRLVLRITGGSLQTVSDKFADWVRRMALKEVDPNDPRLELPHRVGLRLQHLLGHLAHAIREDLRTIPDPTTALLAAARLGEHQAMRAEIASLKSQNGRLQESLAALTHQLAKAEAEALAQVRLATDLENAVDQLGLALQGKRRAVGNRGLARVISTVQALEERARRSAQRPTDRLRVTAKARKAPGRAKHMARKRSARR